MNLRSIIEIAYLVVALIHLGMFLRWEGPDAKAGHLIALGLAMLWPLFWVMTIGYAAGKLIEKVRSK